MVARFCSPCSVNVGDIDTVLPFFLGHVLVQLKRVCLAAIRHVTAWEHPIELQTQELSYRYIAMPRENPKVPTRTFPHDWLSNISDVDGRQLTFRVGGHRKRKTSQICNNKLPYTVMPQVLCLASGSPS